MACMRMGTAPPMGPQPGSPTCRPRALMTSRAAPEYPGKHEHPLLSSNDAHLHSTSGVLAQDLRKIAAVQVGA